jgi:hypothetical protein
VTSQYDPIIVDVWRGPSVESDVVGELVVSLPGD